MGGGGEREIEDDNVVEGENMILYENNENLE